MMNNQSFFDGKKKKNCFVFWRDLLKIALLFFVFSISVAVASAQKDPEGESIAFKNSMDLSYTVTQKQIKTTLSTPVKAPDFTLRDPDGTYSLSDYRQNSLMLVFGRPTCPNTKSLLNRIQTNLPGLYNSGVEVLVSLESVSSLSDVIELESAYPYSHFTYENLDLMWTFLQTIEDSLGSVTYPAVFIINSSLNIIYYSTGYVSDLDALLSEALSTATGKSLPAPKPVNYVQYKNGHGNLKNVSGSSIITELRNQMNGKNKILFLTSFYPTNDTVQVLEAWEENYSLYNALEMRLVVSYDSISDDDKALFPHVTFADFNSDDLDILQNECITTESVFYPEIMYLFGSNGDCISWITDEFLDLLNIWAVLCSEDIIYDMNIPTSLAVIKENSFSGSAFKTINLTNENLTTIGNSAFAGVSNLSIVRIPRKISSIADNAFPSNNKLIIICDGSSYACIYAINHNITYLSR